MDRSPSAPLGFPLMKPSTAEDCLEALHALSAAHDLIPVPAVARWLGVQCELAAVMIEQIAGEGLAERPTGRGVRLTSHGRQEATRVIRRRRLLESRLIAEHGYALEAAQVIAARLAYAVPDDVVAEAADVYGEPDLTPRAEPAPAWALAMRGRLAHTVRSVAQTC